MSPKYDPVASAKKRAAEHAARRQAALNPQQFGDTGVEMVHPSEIGYLESRDYAGKLKDLEFRPGGESDQRVKEIMESAKMGGIREPLDIRSPGTRSYLHDGHHRYVAAKRLGIKVPVERS